MEVHIEYLEKQIRNLEEEITRLRNAVFILKGGDINVNSNKNDNTFVLLNKTIKEIILEALEDGIPKTKNELLPYIQKYKGSGYKTESLSPQISLLVGKIIQKEIFLENPIASKFYYGKIEWFKDGKLELEYVKKIKCNLE